MSCCKPRDVDVEAVHQLLGPVRDQRRSTLGHERDERVADRRVAQEVGVDVGGAVAVRERRSPRSALVTGAPSQRGSSAYGSLVDASSPNRSSDRGRVAHHVDLDVEVAGLDVGRRRGRLAEPLRAIAA